MTLKTTTVLRPALMTPTERLLGRFLRAPDHDAGSGADAGADGAAAATDGTGVGGGDEGEGATVLGGEAEGATGKASEDEAGSDGGEGGADAGADGPPEKYELSAPDGFDAIDTEVLAEAEPVLRELNLTNDQANKLMPMAGALVKKTMDRAEKAITDRAISQRKEWAEAFEKDAEIGGANKDATIAATARAFGHYGLKKGEGLRQLLDESGLGNHPDLIRFVAAVGRDLAEGSFDRGGAATHPKTAEQTLYGPEFQPKG